MNFSVDTRSVVILGLTLVGSVAAYCGYIYSFARKDDSKNKKLKLKSDKPRNNSSVIVEDEIDENLKGYKKTSDGRTTSYFNRELSDADAKLLGDCKPKKISAGDSPISNSPKLISTSPPPNNTSAWNAAGTWEEKSFTKWAHKELRNILQACRSTVRIGKSSAVFTFTKVASIDGEVYVTHTRGKKLYLYDLGIQCSWELTLESGDKVRGGLGVTELTPDGDIEVWRAVRAYIYLVLWYLLPV